MLGLGGDDVGGKADEFSEAVGKFGLEVLAFFHFGKVVLKTEQYAMKLRLICLLPHVEFDYPSLQDRDQIEDEVVVCLLLLPSSKPRVD